ncbi:MAG: hypothetical protein JNL11_16835 [Bdellovibrionaceae bacterium]|nr:hypothetical protein [Pseudobdellovibrionaceae bacterium]
MYFLIAALKDEVTELVVSEKNHLILSGVGKLKTIVTLSDLFYQQSQPMSCLINLGTVGSERIPAGQLVEVTRSFQRDTTFFSEPISLPKLTQLPAVACGSADRVWPCEAQDPWDVVDMELYALAFFCREKEIPLVSIKYVTDQNDVSVYKEWKKQLPMASQMLSHFWNTQKEAILEKILSNTRS